MSPAQIDLPALFTAVQADLEARRQELNQADGFNHDHGDHMVEIFSLAAQAAEAMRDAPIADAMEHAASLLRQRSENGSAQVYARGLELLARQLRQRQVSLDDLLLTVRGYLKKPEEGEGGKANRSAGVVKALMTALSDWSQAETNLAEGGVEEAASSMDLGYLLGVGMAYLQAKQKGGDQLDVLSETVVSASPLGKVPYRSASGEIAIRALVKAMGG